MSRLRAFNGGLSAVTIRAENAKVERIFPARAQPAQELGPIRNPGKRASWRGMIDLQNRRIRFTAKITERAEEIKRSGSATGIPTRAASGRHEGLIASPLFNLLVSRKAAGRFGPSPMINLYSGR